jgi:hypothetical protein
MPPRMFSVEGVMGLRSWRYADGTANLRAVVAANSSIADGVASALKPRRTRVSPYPAAATARAIRISETAFQGFMSTSPVLSRHDLPGLGILLNDQRLAATQKSKWGGGGSRTSVPSSEVQGDDQPGCVLVSSPSARPSAGRYRPKFNSKSLGYRTGKIISV